MPPNGGKLHNIICIENNYGRKIIQNIKEDIFQKEIY